MEQAIGTKVRINCPASRHHGEECTVISNGFVANIYHRGALRWPSRYVQKVDLPIQSAPGVIQPYSVWKPEWLVPVYDGNEKVAWSECAWQPKQLVC